MRRFALALILTVMMGLPTQVTLAATECNGTVTGAIRGGLVVHASDTCNVSGANVSGGIHMDGGVLNVCGSTVTGGIIANILPANRLSSSVIIGLGSDDVGSC